jgi:hypothetical protein
MISQLRDDLEKSNIISKQKYNSRRNSSNPQWVAAVSGMNLFPMMLGCGSVHHNF